MEMDEQAISRVASVSLSPISNGETSVIVTIHRKYVPLNKVRTVQTAQGRQT